MTQYNITTVGESRNRLYTFDIITGKTFEFNSDESHEHLLKCEIYSEMTDEELNKIVADDEKSDYYANRELVVRQKKKLSEIVYTFKSEIVDVMSENDETWDDYQFGMFKDKPTEILDADDAKWDQQVKQRGEYCDDFVVWTNDYIYFDNHGYGITSMPRNPMKKENE